MREPYFAPLGDVKECTERIKFKFKLPAHLDSNDVGLDCEALERIMNSIRVDTLTILSGKEEDHLPVGKVHSDGSATAGSLISRKKRKLEKSDHLAFNEFSQWSDYVLRWDSSVLQKDVDNIRSVKEWAQSMEDRLKEDLSQMAKEMLLSPKQRMAIVHACWSIMMLVFFAQGSNPSVLPNLIFTNSLVYCLAVIVAMREQELDQLRGSFLHICGAEFDRYIISKIAIVRSDLFAYFVDDEE